MRGVVTLAAPFVIPPATPHRDVLLLIAFTVTAGTLFIQGCRCPGSAQVEVPSPDPAADALARANLLHQAGQAGLAELAELEEDDPHSVSEQIRDRVLRRDDAAWERFGASDEETPSDVYAGRRKLMIDAERTRMVEIRDPGTVAHEVVDDVLSMMDIEESMLDYSAEERERVGASQRCSASRATARTCRRCDRPSTPTPPASAATACARAPTGCTCDVVLCGHIACCDSSPERHASAHHAETGHEVMRSAEAARTGAGASSTS